MSETVERKVHTPTSEFNHDDKSAGPVTYVGGKLPRGGSVGNSHKQSKDAGVGGKNYKGHGGSGYPGHGKYS